MKTIDAVIVDTYPQNRLAHLAIEKTVQTGLIRRVHTFSTAPIYPGEDFHRINPIESTGDYSHFMLNIVPYFMDADATLVIQWDGMPHSKEKWNEDFLNCDYIGAPWGSCYDSMNVGNGGFSLRSRKLMDTLTTLKIKCDPALLDADAEDVVICKHYREAILNSGCTFALFALAEKFSAENSGRIDTFGFHGVFNFPHFLREDELIGHTNELLMRTNRDLFVINFIIGCFNRNYRALLDETRESIRKFNTFSRIIQKLIQAKINIPGFS